MAARMSVRSGLSSRAGYGHGDRGTLLADDHLGGEACATEAQHAAPRAAINGASPPQLGAPRRRRPAKQVCIAMPCIPSAPSATATARRGTQPPRTGAHLSIYKYKYKYKFPHVQFASTDRRCGGDLRGRAEMHFDWHLSACCTDQAQPRPVWAT